MRLQTLPTTRETSHCAQWGDPVSPQMSSTPHNASNTISFTHRHDASHKPQATDLSAHLYYSTACNFQDLQVHILEQCKVRSQEHLQQREDYWIGKLGTRYPGGMNSRTGEVYATHC